MAAVTTDGRTVYIKGASTVSGSCQWEDEDTGEVETITFEFATLVDENNKHYLFAFTFSNGNLQLLSVEDGVYNTYSTSPGFVIYQPLMQLVEGIIPVYIYIPTEPDGGTLSFANFDLAKWIHDGVTPMRDFCGMLVINNQYMPDVMSGDNNVACVDGSLKIQNSDFDTFNIVDPDFFIIDCNYTVTSSKPQQGQWNVMIDLTGDEQAAYLLVNAYNLVWYYGFPQAQFPWMQGA